jgi:hypothetical protein
MSTVTHVGTAAGDTVLTLVLVGVHAAWFRITHGSPTLG